MAKVELTLVLKDVELKPGEEKKKIKGHYDLMNGSNKLASQGFNVAYGDDDKVSFSMETQKAALELQRQLQADLETQLGLATG